MNPTVKPTEPTKTIFQQQAKGFLTTVGVSQTVDTESKKLQDRLDAARIFDIRFKIGLRILFTVFFMGLLGWQNWEVFTIVARSLKPDILKDLQLIFATLVGATLTETYLITRTIVEWMFKEIDYTGQKVGV